MLPKLVTIISIFNDIFYCGHNNVIGSALNANETANFFLQISPKSLPTPDIKQLYCKSIFLFERIANPLFVFVE